MSTIRNLKYISILEDELEAAEIELKAVENEVK